jgi:acetoin utilization deacetylase AcuC-like enzyme
VLILDGDAHYGDGTEDCLQHLGLAAQITNITRNQIGAKAHSAYTAAKWRSFTSGLIDQYKPGLVIYQAGADAWNLDPYESGYLSMTGLKYRDEGVFKACKQAGVPVAWNLAGGYSDPMQLTIDIHLQTLAVSDRVFVATHLDDRQ